ncbi:MAG: hypothetical protein H6828_16000 [Planctomycetes bacterium]|nr:hypothetical protein [Planctomycetota bacterium]
MSVAADEALGEEEYVWEIDEVCEPLPDDPIELGPCRLHLSVVLRESRLPVKTHAWLWRLDAPPTEFYQRGDQLQAEVEVPEHGLWIDDLPAGRYRAVCREQVAGQDDPPAFEVRGLRDEVVLELAEPRRATARLFVYTADGTRVTRVTRLSDEDAVVFGRTYEPTWRAPRPLKDPSSGYEEFEEGMFWPDGAAVGVVDDGAGFALAELREPRVDGESAHRQVYQRDGENRIEVDLGWRDATPLAWCALSVPTRSFADALWLAEGGQPDPNLLQLEVVCVARRLEELPVAAPWSEVELEVGVTYPDHDPLAFTWRPADGPPGDRFLRRSAP